MGSKRKERKEATEELVRTQVLNIDELRKVEKYEKKISKKPAGICALFGAILILIGGGTQGYIMYQQNLELDRNIHKKEIHSKDIIEETPKREIISGKSQLVCELSMQGNADGTNYVSTFTYDFVDSELKNVTKYIILEAIPGAENGMPTMTQQYDFYKNAFLTNGTIPGYSIFYEDRWDVGYNILTKQDLSLVNPTLLPTDFTSNPQLSVDNKLNDYLPDVQKAIEGKNYTCSLKK